MAITIAILSNELLAETIKYLANDRKQILSLALTCRQISPIAREVLYRDIALDFRKLQRIVEHGGPFSSHQSPFGVPGSGFFLGEWSRLLLLLRTWHENPSLQLQTISTFAIHSWDSQSEGVFQLLMGLSMARNLRSLKIHGCQGRNVDALVIAFGNPARDVFPALQNLEIQTGGGYVFSSDLRAICAHQSLRRIRIDVPVCHSAQSPSSFVFHGRSNLKSLVVSHPMFHQDALWSILLVTPDLESLDICVPLYMVAIRNPHVLRGVDAIGVTNAYQWRKV